MLKLYINVDYRYDKLGDEHLRQRDFSIVVEIDDGEYVVCSIDDMETCYIKRQDLIRLGKLLQGEE